MCFSSPISEIPVAYFYTCLSLVRGTLNPIDDKQVYDDTYLSTDKIGSFVGERRRVYLSAAYQF